MGGVCFSLWVFKARQAAVIVASDKQAQDATQPVDVAREAATFAIQRRHITAQICISAFDGVSLLFPWGDIMACYPFALPINQFVVSGKSIAVKLMDWPHQ